MFQVKRPFPSRKAAESLRDQLVDYLVSTPVRTGQAFYSDSELVEISGLSRKAVRRAMDDLQRQGWIERVTGKGSYVGARASLPVRSYYDPRGGQKLTRLAVLVYAMLGPVPDSYSGEVIGGIDEIAASEGITIELLGNYTTEISVLSQRLAQTRPDALAVMPATSRHAFIIGEAQRLNIPCVLTGTRLLDLHLPTAYEDGHQGAALAVKYLADRGHRRIGLLQRSDSAPWVFARREGYVQGMLDCGLQHDERLVCWLKELDDDSAARNLKQYLDVYKPTALLLSSAWHTHAIGKLMRAGELRVPEDLSLISFDRNMTTYQIHLGMQPTTVDLPLRAMGREIARMASRIAGGEHVTEQVSLPCTIGEGESVRPLIA